MLQGARNRTIAALMYAVEGDETQTNEFWISRADRFLEAVQELDDLLYNFNIDDYPDNLEEKIQEQFYNVGKKFYGEEKTVLLGWFKDIYIVMFREVRGPRIGQFVRILGIDLFLERLHERIYDPFEMLRR